MAGAARPLNDRQKAFVRHYLVSLNASDAYRKAGYTAKDANVAGPRLLADVRIAKAVAEGQQKRAAKLEIESESVLQRLWDIVNADPSALTKHHVGSCRYCWGEDHLYHWKTAREFGEAERRARRALPKEPTPDELEAGLPTDDGGYGYRLNRPPCPDCPECGGLGIEYVRFADTDTMTPGQRLLFQGVKESKDGKSFILADRVKALEMVGKHLGMFKEREQSPLEDALTALLRSAQGTPLPIATPTGFGDDQ